MTKTSPCWKGLIVPGIDIDVGIQFLVGDPQAPAFQDGGDGGGGQPFAERGKNASRDKDEFRFHFFPDPLRFYLGSPPIDCLDLTGNDFHRFPEQHFQRICLQYWSVQGRLYSLIRFLRSLNCIPKTAIVLPRGQTLR